MSLKNKVGKLDNIARLRVIKRPPSVSDGQNGDMLLGNISGKLILYIKYNNSWNSVPLRKGNKQSTSDNLAGFSHDTGWFAVNSPTDDRLFYDSNNITVGAGKYTIKHNAGTPFVRTEVFCRFAADDRKQQSRMVVNLTSHISHSGSNANKYGYWIKTIDSNTFDLHIFPDGLTILHSELFEDDAGNTANMVTSNDIVTVSDGTKKYPSIEMRLFVYPIRTENNIPDMGKISDPLDNPHIDEGSPINDGNTIVGTGGASREGTNEDSFYISGNKSTGILLKQDTDAFNTGILKVRNIGDTADASIQCSSVKDAAGKDSISVYKTPNAVNHLQVKNSISGTSTAGPTLTIAGTDNDASLKLEAKGNGIVQAIRATSGDGAENATGLRVDFDRTVASSGTNAHNDIGIDLDVNSASLGTSSVKGMDIDIVGATSGTHTATGIELNVSGADANEGLVITNFNGGKDIVLKSSANTADYCNISTSANGETTISTVDDGAATAVMGAHLNIEPDGHVEFDNCGVGFDLVTALYHATNSLVDFRLGNKQFFTFDGGSATNLLITFPKTSGNFTLLIKQDGTGSRTITNYRAYESDETAAAGSSSVKFAGGSNPTLTTDANHVDILSFFWDCDAQIAYGVATLDFQF